MPTGQTQDAGWEIGVSRTLDATPHHLWALLTSPEGLELWLGPGVELATEGGTSWEADDGTAGEIRRSHEGERIRLTCRPAGWDHETTVQ